MKKNLLKTLAICFTMAFSARVQAQTTLWGMTSSGGLDDKGTIFNYSPTTNTNEVEFNFVTNYIGANPEDDKVVEVNGKIYGITRNGGDDDYGVLYEYDIATGVYVVIKKFNYSSGFSPKGGLMKASNGKIYGCTTSGTNIGFGGIFEFDPTTSVFINKYPFYNNDGNQLGSRLVEFNGELYGGAEYGANSWNGSLFKYNYTTNAFAVLKTFNNSND